MKTLLRKYIWINNEYKELVVDICDRIYLCRNDFLHGNPIDIEKSRSLMTHDSLFGVSAPLYRMALASFLNLKYDGTVSGLGDAEHLGQECAERITFRRCQLDFEREISGCRHLT